MCMCNYSSLAWSLLLLIIWSYTILYCFGQQQCEPLRASENVKVTCFSPQSSTLTRNNGCSEPQMIGTIASYSCQNYFIPFEQKQSDVSKIEHQMKCLNNGNWSRLSKFNSFLCIQDCGRRRINPSPLIVNGELVTNRTLFPWHVSIYREKYQTRSFTTTSTVDSKTQNETVVGQQKEFTYICGGSIVRDSIILTAAHCVTTAGNKWDHVEPLAYKVVVGAQTNNFAVNTRDSLVSSFNIKRIYVYDGFDPLKDFQGDIALLQLDGSIQFDDYVSPICLPTETALEAQLVQPGKLGEVAGFGRDETGNYSYHLKYGALKVKTRAECFHSLDVRLSELQLCAGTLKDSGSWITVCNGDSGGGLSFASPVLERHYVYGITSFANPTYRNRRIDSDNNNVCQNNAVFTRVLPFMPWIRSVIEQIHGTTLRELSANTMVPYIQRGNEIRHRHIKRLAAIPTSLENRITSIELSNLLIDPNELFKTLESTKLLQSLNMSNTKLTAQFNHRITIPHLNSFVLDIATKFIDGGSVHSDRFTLTRDPFQFFQTTLDRATTLKLNKFIKSNLFFNQDYDAEWTLDQILQLRINIQLTYYIYKIININYEDGRVVLNNVPATNDILRQMPTTESEFKLRHLALSRCHLKLTEIAKRGERSSSIQSLILNNLESILGRQSLSQLIRRLPHLQVLVVGLRHFPQDGDDIRKSTLHLSQFPPRISHLSLSNVILNFTFNDRKTRILFPDSISNMTATGKHVLPVVALHNLRSFNCDGCIMDKMILKTFSARFPNLIHLFLKNIDPPNFNIKRLTEQINSLKSILLVSSTGRSLMSTYPDLTQLVRIPATSESIFIVKSSNNTWTIRNTPTTYIDYQFQKLSTFSTSWADLHYGRRLKHHELNALKTGNFIFQGQNELLLEDYVEPFPELQFLASKLKNLIISNVEVSSKELGMSLHSSILLRKAKFVDISLVGKFISHVKPSEYLHSFKLHVAELRQAVDFPHFGIKLNKSHLQSLIPFKFSRSGSLILGGIQEFSLELENNILIQYHTSGQLLTMSSLSFTNQILNNWNPSLDFTIKNLSICSSLLNPALLPSTVQFLHLNSIVIPTNPNDDNNVVSAFLNKFYNLTHLRFFDPKIQENQGGDFIDNPPVEYEETNYLHFNLADLKNNTGLQHLALSDLRILANISNINNNNNNNNNSLPILSSIQSLYTSWTSFESSFLVSNFWAIFPSVTKVGLISGYFESLFTIQNWIHYEQLILATLQNERIDWLLFTFHKNWTLGEDHHASPYVAQIKKILSPGGVFNKIAKNFENELEGIIRDKGWEYEIERRASGDGSWTLVPDEQDAKYKGIRTIMMGPNNNMNNYAHYNCENDK